MLCFRKWSVQVHLAIMGLLLAMWSCSSCVLKRDAVYGEFSYGIIADCQYCNIEGTGVRKYSLSDAKLEECVAHLNTINLEYTIHLGDFIDRDWESFDIVGPIYNSLKMPHYHVLGNHDFAVPDDKKRKVREELDLPSDYYDFELKGWRFIVLNGNDIGFHAYPEDSKEFALAVRYYEQIELTSPKWNGAIGPSQLKWLKSVLRKACRQGKKVVIYCHFPVYPENVHNLWNAKEVIGIIEQYPCVKAYMNGHNHDGNYGIKNGIHYLTFKGMVDTEKSSYGVVKVFQDHLQVNGFGREDDRMLEIR